MTQLLDLEKRQKLGTNTLTKYWNRIRHLPMIMTLHVGEYKFSCRTSDFNGWLQCDGRSLSQSDYSALFNVLGTSFGSDDETTFKLPNFSGRVMGAIGTGSGLTPRLLGAAVGEESHLLTTGELPSHTHTGTTDTDGAHTHTATTSSAGSHSHTHNANGGSGATGLAYANGSDTASGLDSTGGTELNLTSTAALTIASNGAHTHDMTVASAGSHTHAFTTNASGTGGSHNNMQPTLFGGNCFIFVGFQNM
jgi:microcystin-dependent protein